MRVPCRLREIRGRRPLRDIADQAGVNRGTLSMIELGRMLPKDEQIPGLEHAYGRPVEDFYSPRVLLALADDEGVA